ADAAHACEKLRDLVRKDRTLERDDAVADMDLYRCRVRHDASERGPDPILEDDVVGRARFEDRPDRWRRADRAITQIPPDDPDAVSGFVARVDEAIPDEGAPVAASRRVEVVHCGGAHCRAHQQHQSAVHGSPPVETDRYERRAATERPARKPGGFGN